MSTVQTTDNLLVHKAGVDYKLPISRLKTEMTPAASGGITLSRTLVNNASGWTWQSGDLKFTASGTRHVLASQKLPATGKWYWEVEAGSTAGSSWLNVGISEFATPGNTSYPGHAANSYSVNQSGQKANNGSNTNWIGSINNPSTVGVVWNADTRALSFVINNTAPQEAWNNLSVPSNGFAPAFGWQGSGAAGTQTVNFGATPFIFTKPADCQTLHDYYTPDPSSALVTPVSRGGTIYATPVVDMSSKVQNTDWLPIGRSGITYKVLWSDVMNTLINKPTIGNTRPTSVNALGSNFDSSYPSGLVTGDLLVGFMSCFKSVSSSWPTNWSSFGSDYTSSAPYCYTKRYSVTSSPPTGSIQITIPSNTAHCGIVVAFRNGLNGAATNITGSSSTTVSGSISNLKEGSILLCIIVQDKGYSSADSNAAADIKPEGFTEIFKSTSNSVGNSLTFNVSYKVITAATASLSVTSRPTLSAGNFVMSLRELQYKA